MVKLDTTETIWWEDEEEVQKIIEAAENDESFSLDDCLTRGGAPFCLEKKDGRYNVASIQVKQNYFEPNLHGIWILVRIKDYEICLEIGVKSNGRWIGRVLRGNVRLSLSYTLHSKEKTEKIFVAQNTYFGIHPISLDDLLVDFIDKFDVEHSPQNNSYIFDISYFFPYNRYVGHHIFEDLFDKCLKKNTEVVYQFIPQGYYKAENTSGSFVETEWRSDTTVYSEAITNKEIETIASHVDITILESNYDLDNEYRKKGFVIDVFSESNVSNFMFFLEKISKKQRAILSEIFNLIGPRKIETSNHLSLKIPPSSPFQLHFLKAHIEKYLEFEFKNLSFYVSTSDTIKYNIGSKELKASEKDD